MKRVLVLDANQRCALAVTRSLGRRGIYIITAEETPFALASTSRFSQQHIIYPSPKAHPLKFIKFLSEYVKDQHIDILLPMTELTTMLLSRHKIDFPGAILPFPEIETVETFDNKCQLMQTAKSLNVPVPESWHAEDPYNLPCKLDSLPYPIVLKPGKSWLLHLGQWQRTSVRFASNPAQARNILESDWAFKAHPFMIQENITGHGEGVFAIYDNGKPVATFAHKRLREKPPSGGVSVLSESINVDPVLGGHAHKLLQNANWHGVAMVEFKLSNDGTPNLMEINTRFWGSLQLSIDSGIDFPWLLYQIASSMHPDKVNSYKVGIKLRWLLGDVDNLYLTLRDKQLPLFKKIGALRCFLTPSPFSTRHEVNRWGDIMPAWYEFKKYIKDIL